jgi:hypothetical protein
MAERRCFSLLSAGNQGATKKRTCFPEKNQYDAFSKPLSSLYQTIMMSLPNRHNGFFQSSKW